ncbi:apicortin, putative [Plasmodium vivax]|uniref:Apicortin, putative n=1 Tax=Plasmodium vivax TaxID=5855 RepID=A0A564ZW07_PLAVI|nr:apicortin, putative [Plasmodium vivax]
MDCTHLHAGGLIGSPHLRSDGDLQCVKKHFCCFAQSAEKVNFPLEVGTPKEKQRRHRNVFDRLTDANFYTGMHKQKFDTLRSRAASEGTSQKCKLNNLLTRGGNPAEQPPRGIFQKKGKTGKPCVVPLGVQKYGIQIARPKNIWLFRNGDEHHNGLLFLVKPHVHNWTWLLSEITKVLGPTIGPVRTIYNANFRQVHTVEALNDGEKYLCTSGEPPARVDRLSRFLSRWVMHGGGPHAG